LDRRLGRPQSQSGHSGEQKNSQFLLVLESLIIQPIAQHYTEIFQLLKLSLRLTKQNATKIYWSWNFLFNYLAEPLFT
jgi:hypothetical protein